MMNKYRYTYAMKVTENNYASELIELPIDDKGEPDYQYMSSYIRGLDGNVTDIPDYFLQEGYARAVYYAPNGTHRKEFNKLQKKAKKAKKGFGKDGYYAAFPRK